MAASELALGDVVTLQRGTTYKSALLGLPGPVLLGLASIQRNGGFRDDSLKTYSGESPEKLMLYPGDIYVSLKDVTQSADLLGSVARVPPHVRAGRLTQDTVKLSFIRDDVPPDYLYWLLRTPLYREYCRARAIGTTNLSLAREDFLAFPIIKPGMRELAITETLNSLDRKLDLCRRISVTLERMARALFQSWFVDFDSARSKLNAHQTTGFEESLIGPIPRGWRVESVENLATRIAIGPFGSNITRDNFVKQGVPVVRGSNLTDGFRDEDFVFLTDEKATELKNSIAYPGDIIFTHRGTLGQVGIIPLSAKYPKYMVSQSQMLLSVDKGKISPLMVYFFFRSPQGQAALLANTNTTGVPAIARPTSSLKSIQLIVPPVDLCKRFEKIVTPFLQLKEQNARTMDTLAALRDTLLPQLLSGGLRTNASEKFL